MTPGSTIPASLIVVSRHRPRTLLRTLAGIAQGDHPQVEVIVVADPAAAAGVRAAGWTVKLAEFDEPNISAARNLGLSLAAAPVVAFIDDDAVPEPTWATRLTAPFADSRVTAAGGFVRGRSGLAWQWKAMTVGRDATDRPLRVPGSRTSLHEANADRAVKTQGTNCAFRTDALRAAGGFDPAYRFYLDEADLNLRLAAAGGLTAVVPDAVVHHGFAESDRRRADRVPTTLHEIGASLAVFLRRHAPADPAAALSRHRAAEWRRAVGHMVEGRIEPRDVGRLMASLDGGLAEGRARPLADLPPLSAAPPAFLPLPGTGPRPGVLVAGPTRRTAALEAEAAAARAAGQIVTLLTLAPGFRRHRMSFRDDGIWHQTGGRLGRSDRDTPWTPVPFDARVAMERQRLAAFRPVAQASADPHGPLP
jgi:GT2 family glycosyltransferase